MDHISDQPRGTENPSEIWIAFADAPHVTLLRPLRAGFRHCFAVMKIGRPRRRDQHHRRRILGIKITFLLIAQSAIIFLRANPDFPHWVDSAIKSVPYFHPHQARNTKFTPSSERKEICCSLWLCVRCCMLYVRATPQSARPTHCR